MTLAEPAEGHAGGSIVARPGTSTDGRQADGSSARDTANSQIAMGGAQQVEQLRAQPAGGLRVDLPAYRERGVPGRYVPKVG